MEIPILNDDYQYKIDNLKDIFYQELDLSKTWQEFNISHDLTDKGIECFSEDWNTLVGK